MDAPLQDCSMEEQRGVVRFLWAGGAKLVEIHRRMLAQYGQSTMSQRKGYEWVERFKSGQTRVTDEGHSCRPSTFGLCRKICKIAHSYFYYSH